MGVTASSRLAHAVAPTSSAHAGTGFWGQQGRPGARANDKGSPSMRERNQENAHGGPKISVHHTASTYSLARGETDAATDASSEARADGKDDAVTWGVGVDEE